jgi:hypothetical protein
MAENTKKGVRIKTQKQSYEVLVYKETYVKVVTRLTHNLLSPQANYTD